MGLCKKIISENGLQGIWKRSLQEETVIRIMDPFGGRMNEIPESNIPFPHRKGILYNIQYLAKLDVNEVKESDRYIQWIRMLYRYLKPYVSKYPRTAYVNYRDLDLGTHKHGNKSYSEARDWGAKYFIGNFKRLVQVKTKVDPDNFFKKEQRFHA